MRAAATCWSLVWSTLSKYVMVCLAAALRESNLKLIRPKNFEELSVEELAREFLKHGLTRERLAEVMQKMKEFENRSE